MLAFCLVCLVLVLLLPVVCLFKPTSSASYDQRRIAQLRALGYDV